MEETAARRTKRKKRQPFVLDFENPPEMDLSAFEPPPDPRSTLLVNRGVSVNTLLPKDLHYEALNLVRLFLRPSVLVFLSLVSLVLAFILCHACRATVGSEVVLCWHAIAGDILKDI